MNDARGARNAAELSRSQDLPLIVIAGLETFLRNINMVA